MSLELVKVGTMDKVTYLVFVPEGIPSAEIEKWICEMNGYEFSPDSYDVTVICRVQMDGCSNVLGIGPWAVYEEVC
jgi:hypothetical protein